MLGLDTLYDNHVADAEVRRLARTEARIVLTRDRDLLKCRDVTHGCYVHALKPAQQLRELVDRLQFVGQARPFTLCLHCNSPLHPIEKVQVLDRLPPSVAVSQSVFRHCTGCSRVFWQGDHYRRMNGLLNGLVPAIMAVGGG